MFWINMNHFNFFMNLAVHIFILTQRRSQEIETGISSEILNTCHRLKKGYISLLFLNGRMIKEKKQTQNTTYIQIFLVVSKKNRSNCSSILSISILYLLRVFSLHVFTPSFLHVFLLRGRNWSNFLEKITWLFLKFSILMKQREIPVFENKLEIWTLPGFIYKFFYLTRRVT